MKIILTNGSIIQFPTGNIGKTVIRSKGISWREELTIKKEKKLMTNNTNSYKEDLETIFKYAYRAIDELEGQNVDMESLESAFSLLACIKYRTRTILNKLEDDKKEDVTSINTAMLTINAQERRSGKTTTAIELLNEDSNAILLVANQYMKNFLRGNYNVYERVFTYKEFLNGDLKGMKFIKVIIDEGLTKNSEAMARLYYELGRQHIKTIVYGTV